ncbi:YebC/PmpR family DNA-binding transcriptional regulator [Shimazuella sp. AN120528]|uniref:YebC/PmpR family DNA-binding transcriptional regulator n=1 Tax=Shimazuella soli TaxID=1892854 RepID=UPI001F0DAA61|nr:YebC/PmpR family DNA-binding transcriptional regulator [Shimazuella soli]MCH5584118.1 YebC/PmpR family DNA-binding transcriptional regulator [Shimazuella soli]
MAGHSKWKNIQHRKGRQDAIKGKIFAKLSKEIYVAARRGDKDPANNNQLRLAIAKAKSQNMPNDNIERAIKKAAGEGDGSNYESIMYEGYGPDGIAVLVEALTDNRNRTAADVRFAFTKRGGNLGESGCVSWMFHRYGVIEIAKEEVSIDEEEMELLLLDLDPEDIEITEESYIVYVSPDRLEEVQEQLQSTHHICLSSADVMMIPENKIHVKGDTIKKVLDLIETLEDHDDVQAVFTNFDADEEEIEKFS